MTLANYIAWMTAGLLTIGLLFIATLIVHEFIWPALKAIWRWLREWWAPLLAVASIPFLSLLLVAIVTMVGSCIAESKDHAASHKAMPETLFVLSSRMDSIEKKLDKKLEVAPGQIQPWDNLIPKPWQCEPIKIVTNNCINTIATNIGTISCDTLTLPPVTLTCLDNKEQVFFEANCDKGTVFIRDGALKGGSKP